MRPALFLILCYAVAAGTYLIVPKKDKVNRAQQLKAMTPAMDAIAGYLPQRASLVLARVDVQDAEALLKVRWLLFPRNVEDGSLQNLRGKDTVLVLRPRNSTDSLLNAEMPGATVIGTANDSTYQYLLMCRKCALQ